MKNWLITYSGRSCTPVLVAEDVQKDFPTLTFAANEKQFTVQFQNRSDYMAARDSSVAVTVKVINAAKTTYWDGAAVNQKN